MTEAVQKTLKSQLKLPTFRLLGKSLVGKSLAGIAIVLGFSIFIPNAYAQEGKTILVLDASGSMWEEIDDGFKIKIAQDVINDLLETLPAEQELGLITYGHRRKDDCGDIEMLVPPGAGTRGAIAEAVSSLNPTGRTPLTDAVLQAADELRIEENAATVILLSDGRETCDLDPCAVGSELEDRGIDFTAHVIGFDIEEENDQDQLRCLAENTGGKFLTASTASELTEAFAFVSAPIEIEQLAVSATVKDKEDNRVNEGLTWSLASSAINADNTTQDSKLVLSNNQQNSNKLRVQLDPGKYTLSVTREEDDSSASLNIDVQRGQQNDFVLTLPTIELFASLVAPKTVFIAERFNVEWDGPNDFRDRLYLSLPDSPIDKSIPGKFLSNENTAEMQAPSEPGEYELRYFHNGTQKILATAVLIVEPSTATLQAADTGQKGSTILIEWTGPGNNQDYIAVAKPGDPEHITAVRTSSGSPLKLQMPVEIGEYELRYVLHKDNKTITTRPITITDIEVSVKGPETANAGHIIQVDWLGPNERGDYIEVGKVGEKRWINIARTSRGSPAELQMPTQPGEYELRYVLDQDKTPLATQPITVVEPVVTITAPDETGAGETISVEWVGPNAPQDFIEVVESGNDKWHKFTYTREGSPLQIQMPPEPGNYELRYVLHQGRTTLATRPITVTQANVSLDAPSEAGIGDTILVNWVGPDEDRDQIVIAKVGDNNYLGRTYTRKGNPLNLQIPAEPGDYEIRYVLDQDNTTLLTRPITVK